MSLVIIYIFNAMEHIVYERVTRLSRVASETNKEAEASAIRKIILSYLITTEIAKQGITIQTEKPQGDTLSFIEYFSIVEAQV